MPSSLKKAYEAAPKTTIKEKGWDGETVTRIVPDPTTVKGSEYLAMEREILRAIDVIYSTDTLEVSARK